MQNLEYSVYYLVKNNYSKQTSERARCLMEITSLYHVRDMAEITQLPLKQVFAIVDLFQGVLEPFEFFLQEEKKRFQCACGVPLADTRDSPSSSHRRVPSGDVCRASFPNHTSKPATQKPRHLSVHPALTLKENIRPTKTTGRAKEESVLPRVRCVAALIWEEMVWVRGKRAPAYWQALLFVLQSNWIQLHN